MEWDRLTETERRVVELVCEGLTNREISERLSVSPRTVQGHLLKVFRKLGVSSRTRLMRVALDQPPAENVDKPDEPGQV